MSAKQNKYDKVIIAIQAIGLIVAVVMLAILARQNVRLEQRMSVMEDDAISADAKIAVIQENLDGAWKVRRHQQLLIMHLMNPPHRSPVVTSMLDKMEGDYALICVDIDNNTHMGGTIFHHTGMHCETDQMEAHFRRVDGHWVLHEFWAAMRTPDFSE